MKLTTRDLILTSLFTALMVVGALIKVPNPFFPLVPITFQLFFCVFAGLLLGSKNALMSQIIYILLGLAGLPVFTGGGGIGYILKPTFGYIIGFALAAWLIGKLTSRQKSIRFLPIFAISTLGLLAAYFVGNIYFYMIYNLYLTKVMSIIDVSIMMLPYMIKDFTLIAIAAYVSTLVIPVIKKSQSVEIPS
ncbi:MAG: biotin transporter BioY [Vallitaleaceae bacterium]|nr:biotin transporter BioY [Vallitaleaceae bacterium]